MLLQTRWTELPRLNGQRFPVFIQTRWTELPSQTSLSSISVSCSVRPQAQFEWAAQCFPRLDLSELPSTSPDSIWVSCPVRPLAWFKWADQYVPRFDLSEFPSASARSIWVGCQVINWKVLPLNIVDNMFGQCLSSWLIKKPLLSISTKSRPIVNPT